jgi:histidyl-tRNA synthetase
MSSNANPARGMRDFLPADVRRREYVIGIIKQVYESYGFEPLETPAVENLETLMGKYGEEGNQLIFKILKRGEKLDVNDKQLADLALRYDLTVPLARVVANYRNDLPKFFKRYQIQPVWRADRPARGRFREFYQCDVDAIGSKSMIVEAEILSAASGILQRLGFADFTVLLNHRELLREMLNASGIDGNLHNDALIALDKLDKIGIEGVWKDMINRGIDKDSSEKLLDFFAEVIEVLNENEFILSSIEEFIGEETQSLKDLRQILELADNSNIKIDASLARGLSYYTGAIMEIVLTSGDFAGSIGGGGRYDELIGMFGKEQIPACGFSLGLERIIVVMEERGMFRKLINEGKLKEDSADVMVASFDEALTDKCLKLANELRGRNLRVLVYPEINQKAKPLKYAERIDVPFVCLLRESELAENKVTLKNMRSGEQEIVSREEIAAKIGK